MPRGQPKPRNARAATSGSRDLSQFFSALAKGGTRGGSARASAAAHSVPVPKQSGSSREVAVHSAATVSTSGSRSTGEPVRQDVPASAPPLRSLVQWRNDRIWKILQESLMGFPSGLKVIELCGGCGSGVEGFNDLLALAGATVECVGHWDIDPVLERIARAVGIPASVLHLGSKNGDILSVADSAFPDAHCLVAGPPCPPWSTKGVKGSWDDPRSKPFLKVIAVIKELAARGCLLFFVLENVLGLRLKAHGEWLSPLEQIMVWLREAVPGWTVEYHFVNTRDYGLPHNRPRLYITGRRHQPFSGMHCLRSFHTMVPLFHVLEKEDNFPARYTVKQQQNLKDWKQLYQWELSAPVMKNHCAMVDISRTPSGRTVWGKRAKNPFVCECLTASGPALHVFSLGEGEEELAFDRPLRTVERARLQGASEAVQQVAYDLDVRDGKRIFGNAMSVPVVASVLGRELRGLMRAKGLAWIQDLLRGPVPTSMEVPVPAVPCVPESSDDEDRWELSVFGGRQDPLLSSHDRFDLFASCMRLQCASVQCSCLDSSYLEDPPFTACVESTLPVAVAASVTSEQPLPVGQKPAVAPVPACSPVPAGEPLPRQASCSTQEFSAPVPSVFPVRTSAGDASSEEDTPMVAVMPLVKRRRG